MAVLRESHLSKIRYGPTSVAWAPQCPSFQNKAGNAFLTLRSPCSQLRKVDRRANPVFPYLINFGLLFGELSLAPKFKLQSRAKTPLEAVECRSMDLQKMSGKVEALNNLQRIDTEIAVLRSELDDYAMDRTVVDLLRDTLGEMLLAVRTLWQALEQSDPSSDQKHLTALLIDERLGRATRVNAELAKDFRADRIRTDQEALSAYLRVLNEIMEQVDQMFGSRQA